MKDDYDALDLASDIIETIIADGRITPAIVGAPIIVRTTAEKISRAKNDAESAKSASERNHAIASGTIAGGMGGAAIATSLVFPPVMPLVALGVWVGFKLSSGK